MSRQISSRSTPPTVIARAIPPQQEDPYLSKLVKLLPADVISVYMLLFNMIKSDPANPKESIPLYWILFILLAVLTPFYLKRIAGIDSWKQILLCEISFIIWIFYIGGPVKDLKIGVYETKYLASMLVPIYTLFIPIFYK